MPTSTTLKICLWNKLGVTLFGHSVPEKEVEAAVRFAFKEIFEDEDRDDLHLQLNHIDPIDPVHGRNGWMIFDHVVLDEALRLLITAKIEQLLPALKQHLIWDGWFTETRTGVVRAIGPYIQNR